RANGPVLCANYPQIPPRRPRNRKASLTDSSDELRETYQHLSQGTHPNRSHVPFLFLGEGSIFPLASIPPVDPLNRGGHVRYLMQEAFWHIGILGYRYAGEARQIGQPFVRVLLLLRRGASVCADALPRASTAACMGTGAR